jgi:hypothetical protein
MSVMMAWAAVALAILGCVEPRESLLDANGGGGSAGGAGGSIAGSGGGGHVDSGASESTGDLALDRLADSPSESNADLPVDSDGAIDHPIAADIGGPDTTNVPDLPALKDNGTACGDRTECKTGNCVEGVCCDGACASKCNSCLAASTGKPTGQCAPVQAGTTHGADCTASDATTCGLDGKCDGAGACRYYANTTVCKGESCLAGTSTYSPMSTCDGHGTCAPQNQSCGNYKCTADNVRCRASCGTDTDCAAAAFCNSAVCSTKLVPKSICSRAEQCASNLCGGRCCNPGTPCKCTQPSQGNLFTNGGFDSDLSDWMFQDTGPTPYYSWSTQDAEGCPFSGSLLMSMPNGSMSRCVTVQPGIAYNFGGWFKSGSGAWQCNLQLIGASNCQQSDSVSEYSLRPSLTTQDWERIAVTTAAMADNASPFFSAMISCEANSTYMDQLFLNAVPGSF